MNENQSPRQSRWIVCGGVDLACVSCIKEHGLCTGTMVAVEVKSIVDHVKMLQGVEGADPKICEATKHNQQQPNNILS